MPDNVLRVGAEFDVGPLIAGTQAAGAAWDQMKAKLIAVAAQAEASGSTLVAQAARFMASGVSAKEAASALQNLGASEKDAASAADVAARSVGMAGVAEAEEASVAVAGAAANAKLSASFNEAGGSATRMLNATAAARVEIAAMTGSTGALGFGLARIAGQSEVLAPLMRAAFPAFLVLAVVEILSQIPEAIEKIIDSLAGWDAAAKKAYQEQISLNEEALKQYLQLATAQEKLNLIGTEGAERKKRETTDTRDELTRYTTELANELRTTGDLTNKISELKKEQKEAFLFQGPLDASATFLRLKADIDEAQKSLENGGKMTEYLKGKVQDLQITLKGLGLEFEDLSTKQKFENTEARINSEITYAKTTEQYELEVYNSRLRLGELTVSQEADLRKRALQTEYEEATAQYGKLRALKIAEAAAEPGKNVQPELARMDTEQTSRHTALQTELLRIDTETQIKERSMYESTARAEIDADTKIAESHLKLVEIEARRTFTKADNPAELQAAAIPYIQAQNDLISNQIAEKQALLEVTLRYLSAEQKPTAAPGTDAFAAQLSSIREKAPEIYAQAQALNSELIALQEQLKSAAINTQNEVTDRIERMNRTQLDDMITAQRGQLSVDESLNQESLRNYETLFREKKITASQFVVDTRTAAEQELTEQTGVYEKLKAAAKEAAQTQIITQEQASKMIAELSKEEANAVISAKKKEEQASRTVALQEQQEAEKAFRAISNTINSGLNQWIDGHKKFGVAVAQMWDQLVVKAADSILKIAENYAVGLIMQQGSEEKSVIMSAKGAAAKAWDSAPNPIIGAIEAAATFATIVALYTPSFEHGGIVPGAIGAAVPIIAHGQEGVLNQKVTNMVNNSASTSRSTSSSANINMENHFHKSSDMSEAAIARTVMRGVKRGTIPIRGSR